MIPIYVRKDLYTSSFILDLKVGNGHSNSLSLRVRDGQGDVLDTSLLGNGSSFTVELLKLLVYD